MLRLLGSARHQGKGLFPRKGFVLVALLTFAPSRRATRPQLASQIWEGVPLPQATGNLRYVIKRIRDWQSANGVGLIDADAVSVSLKSDLASDVDELLQIRGSQAAQDVHRVLSLWAGELLQEERLSGAELENSIRLLRERLARHVSDVILASLEYLDGPTRHRAFDLLEQVSPFDNRVINARIRDLTSAGRGLEAAIFLERATSRLTAELNGRSVEPPRAAWDPGGDVESNLRRVRGGGVRSLPRILMLPPEGNGARTSSPAAVLARSLVSDLSMHLGCLRTFAVIAPFTARRLRAEDPLEAAVEVNADYVVQTRLQEGLAGSRLWFALMRADSGEVLLADAVSVAPTALRKSHAQLSEAIAATLARQLAEAELARAKLTGEESSFVHYLMGTERLAYDLPAIRKAKKHFSRAMMIDPHFAPAVAMCARSLNYEWLVLGRSSTDGLEEAMNLAKTAVELDPLAPNGHWEVGHTLLYLRRLDESLDNIQNARLRAPHLADLAADEADVLVHMGRFGEALQTIEAAIGLNPRTPSEYLWVKGSALYFEGRFNECVGVLTQMKDTMPVARLLAAAYAMLGDMKRAGTQRRRWLSRYPSFKLGEWTMQIPIQGQEAREMMIEGMRRAGFS